MSTIVYQGYQSYSDSNIIETTTLKLKVGTPTTIVENINTSNQKCWSSIQNLSSINYSNEMEKSYIHRLNEHSLALCTENLGSETGTDQNIDNNNFSISSRELKTEQSNYSKVTMSYKNTQTSRKLPPPLTTLRGSNSLQCRTYREGGRLVIKAIEAPKMRTYFHAERSNGRLTLCFLNDENSVSTIDEEDGESGDENDVFEREINDEEEEEEEKGMYMKRDMNGNSHDVEGEIGIVNCQRVSRCKEGRQGKKTFCDWRNPLWVATS